MLLPAIRTWAEWGQMFTNVEQWAPMVRAICYREAIPCHEIEAGYPGTNAVYIVDRAYVVKVYAPFCHGDYDLECDLYPLLACNRHIPAPALLAHGTWRDRIDWPYIVMDYVPGRTVGEVWDEIALSNRVEIASHLGRILFQLHSMSLDGIRALDSSGQEWRQFVRSRKAAFAREFREQDVLPENVVEQCAAWLETAWDGVRSDHLALLNGDVTQDHVLVQRQDGTWQISGLIDFADALIGQIEYEWVALWFGALDREAKAMRAFLAAYDPKLTLQGEVAQRTMAFTLLHEFGADIVRWVLERSGTLGGTPPGTPSVRSFDDLYELLCGNLTGGNGRKDRG